MPDKAANRLQRLWYSNSPLAWLLLPLSALFALVTGVRRALYRNGILRSTKVAAPVVVIGNITVGGTGKTPVTIWLAKELQRRGFRPGVISRGYGGMSGKLPVQANNSSSAEIVGDEPLLIARRSKVPVVVHRQRVAAAEELLRIGVNVILADDGLQHYRLRRDYEIAVVDAARGFGNGWLLPAGPLREPPSRLRSVDRILLHRSDRQVDKPGELKLPANVTSSFHLVNHALVSLQSGESRSFKEFRGKPVHAVAGIGNPERFFEALEQRGLTIVRHPFADHAALDARDLAFDDDCAIVMTEKDAVKCQAFATARHWFVPVDVDMHDASWLDDLERKLRQTRRTVDT
jgi:tetraacyldisaccharide 4'-kinase